MIGYPKCNYTYITAGATTQVFTGTGTLHLVAINKALTGTIKLIDGVAGTTANVGVITNSSGPIGSVMYNVQCGAGLRVVNSATEDITIAWIQ